MKQLRTKFILIAMGSLLVVLAVIVGAVYGASYYNTVSQADRILTMLADNEGRFPDNFPGNDQQDPPAEPTGQMAEPPKDNGNVWTTGAFRGMSAETPYETRYFSVLLNASGEALSADTGKIAAVQTASAIAYAQELFEKGRTSGFYGQYRYLLRTDAAKQETRVLFVDCSSDLNSLRTVLTYGIGISVVGMLAVFGLVVFFSGKVFRPVEESYARQRRFVTDASHELKTPLAIISANVDVLEMGIETLRGETEGVAEGNGGIGEAAPADGTAKWIASIRGQVKRLRKLTEQMVTLSRLDEQTDVPFAEFDLSQAVTEAAEGYEGVAEAMEKRFTTEITPDLRYHGNEEKIRQMVGLFLDNAMKYSAENGEIRLTLAPVRGRGRHIRLELWNTVAPESGIAPGKQDRLFERFYRPDTSRSSQTGGSGIGLSIVRSIAQLHHGSVSAESADGESIRFTVTL